MNIKNLIQEIEIIFLELKFEIMFIGDKKDRYLVYKNCYCKITYLEDWKAIVIESADNYKDALNGVLEDGDLYFIDVLKENLLLEIRKDIIKYYMC